MNRIVLIGNGFDLAHGLKTRYEDFINWYCDLRVYGFVGNLSDISSDILCSFQDLRHQVWNVNAHTNGFNLNHAKGKDIVDYLINKIRSLLKQLCRHSLKISIKASKQKVGWT